MAVLALGSALALLATPGVASAQTSPGNHVIGLAGFHDINGGPNTYQFVARLIKRAVVAAVVCAGFASLATGAQARPASLDQAFDATHRLMTNAADRMAAQCHPHFCMDANEYLIGCTAPTPEGKSTVCAYNLYGYFFAGDEPIGDFDCDRVATVSVTGRGWHQRMRARSVGKTRCRDDRENHAIYPWPRVEGPVVQCWPVSCAPPPPPHKSVREPLKSRGSWVRIS